MIRGLAWRRPDDRRPRQQGVQQHGGELRTGEAVASRIPSNWVAAEELKLSYHNSKTISITIYPYYGSLN